MAQFAYIAIDPSGREKTGRIAAEDRGAAISSVEALGLMPVSIEPDAGGALISKSAGTSRLRLSSKKVSQAQSLAFVRQLGNLLTAGVPLARALQILGKESSSPAAAQQCAEIRDIVVDGSPLAEAMGRFPRSFPPIYVAMIRAGETGGFLDVVLKQIADFMSRERDLKSKVSTALIYPAVLAFIATGVVIFLLAWFIPRFSEIFSEFGQSLPLLTRVIQGASLLVLNYGLFVLAAIVLGVFLARRALKTPAGRRKRDEYILRVPGVGTAAARFALVRFSRMLGTLVGAGVPLLASLRVSREAVGNQTLSDALNEAIADVQEGTSLAASLSRCPRLFPGSVIEMIAVAEESGRLSEELVRMAGEFEEDLDRRLRTLVSLAEPALLFIMASVVGTIVIGMLLPVFDLWNAIE